MPASIEIKVTEDVRGSLHDLAARGRNTRPLLNAVGQIGVDAVEGNFAEQGRPTRWKPLKRPRPNGRTGPILTLWSRLRRSMHYQVAGEAVRIGTNVPYAAAHNQGFRGRVQVPAHTRRITRAFGRRIEPTEARVRAHTRRMFLPRREFLVIPAEEQREIDRTVQDYLAPKS
jgi:phage gpG-like protein